jgi:WD40 repeat protein
MEPAQLKKRRQQLRRRTPLIGGWLQGQALRALNEDGSAEAVRVVEEAAVFGADGTVCAAAFATLRAMASGGNVPAQEALCRLVIHHDHPLARELVSQARYLPHDESQRALYYFLTEQWDQYETLDFERRLLREAYDHGDRRLRNRIAARARRAGRVDWVEVVSSGKQGRRLAEMTDDEWHAALTLLEACERHADLWRLAQEAPPRWSGAMLRGLRLAGWLPRNEEQEGFRELIGLAKKWTVKKSSRPALYHRATLEGHSREVRCLAVGRSGTLLASGSSDRTVRLWQLPDGKALRTLTGHTNWIHALAVTPNGRLLASASRDKTIYLWSLPDGAPLVQLKGHSQAVVTLTINPDGDVLASGGADGVIQLWSLPGGAHIRSLKGHRDGVTCLAVSPDGQLLVSGSGDSTVRLWSLPDGRSLRALEGHRAEQEDGVFAVAVSPDSRTLAAGGTDTWIRLWSVPDGRMLKVLKGHIGQVLSLAFTPDGKLLASGAADHAIRLWRMPSGRVWKVLEGQGGASSDLLVTPDGRMLACCSGGDFGYDHSVRLWSLNGRLECRSLTGHTRSVCCLAMSPDGQLLASGSGDMTIRLWSAELVRLSRTPIAQTSLADLDWVQSVLNRQDLVEDERASLTFIAALMRWRRRGDVFVDEVAPRVIELGEFDIEIEG